MFGRPEHWCIEANKFLLVKLGSYDAIGVFNIHSCYGMDW